MSSPTKATTVSASAVKKMKSTDPDFRRSLTLMPYNQLRSLVKQNKLNVRSKKSEALVRALTNHYGGAEESGSVSADDSKDGEHSILKSPAKSGTTNDDRFVEYASAKKDNKRTAKRAQDDAFVTSDEEETDENDVSSTKEDTVHEEVDGMNGKKRKSRLESQLNETFDASYEDEPMADDQPQLPPASEQTAEPQETTTMEVAATTATPTTVRKTKALGQGSSKVTAASSGVKPIPNFSKIHEKLTEGMEDIYENRQKVLQRHQEVNERCPERTKKMATPVKRAGEPRKQMARKTPAVGANKTKIAKPIGKNDAQNAAVGFDLKVGKLNPQNGAQFKFGPDTPSKPKFEAKPKTAKKPLGSDNETVPSKENRPKRTVAATRANPTAIPMTATKSSNEAAGADVQQATTARKTNVKRFSLNKSLQKKQKYATHRGPLKPFVDTTTMTDGRFAALKKVVSQVSPKTSYRRRMQMERTDKQRLSNRVAKQQGSHGVANELRQRIVNTRRGVI